MFPAVGVPLLAEKYPAGQLYGFLLHCFQKPASSGKTFRLTLAGFRFPGNPFLRKKAQSERWRGRGVFPGIVAWFMMECMSDFQAPAVMGIINCTPDSFYMKSRSKNTEEACGRARQMILEGADILDIGGESTRPGSLPVEDAEQIKRIIPVIRRIREEFDIRLSVDTQSAAVAEEALDAGADIINDISALSDPRMASLAAERGVPVILMHMRGEPRTMQNNPVYQNAAAEVRQELLERVDTALKAGIQKSRIILDPGIGFGKRLEDNIALLRNIAGWCPDGFSSLIGLSRKSFLGRILDKAAEKLPCIADSGPEGRLTATLAAHAWCLGQGVDILRVHDVADTRQIIAVWENLA